MSAELELELEQAGRAITRAADFLSGEYVQGRLCEAVERAALKSASPWADRKAAAAYAHCSISELDRAADAGAFTRYVRAGTPMFRKDEIDQALRDGRWPKRGKALNAEEPV
jgi:hypothetical protein